MLPAAPCQPAAPSRALLTAAQLSPTKCGSCAGVTARRWAWRMASWAGGCGAGSGRCWLCPSPLRRCSPCCAWEWALPVLVTHIFCRDVGGAVSTDAALLVQSADSARRGIALSLRSCWRRAWGRWWAGWAAPAPGCLASHRSSTCEPLRALVESHAPVGGAQPLLRVRSRWWRPTQMRTGRRSTAWRRYCSAQGCPPMLLRMLWLRLPPCM
eukprot:SAG11_NODE_5137_length_1655_cov_1.176735_1_plen_212_part_00